MFIFVLFYRVCAHVRLEMLETRFCVYVCVVVEGMYTCKTGSFGKETLCLCLCLCLCCCRRYVHI